VRGESFTVNQKSFLTTNTKRFAKHIQVREERRGDERDERREESKRREERVRDEN